MKSFYHYLAESEKEYRYRIKSVVPMDAQFVATVERTLFKYEVSLAKAKKTPLQKNPLDFRKFEDAEVWILDVTTRVPASPYVMATMLRGALNVTDDVLIVRGANEPVELEAEALENIHKDDHALLTSEQVAPEGSVQEVPFGDAYNTKFLNYLAQIRANADTPGEEAIEQARKTSKFAWLTKINDDVAPNFNDGYPCVQPVAAASKKKGTKAEKPNMTGNTGAYETSRKAD